MIKSCNYSQKNICKAEVRFVFLESADIDIYCVLDGHGGPDISKFISNHINKDLLNKISLIEPTKDNIKQLIVDAQNSE